MKKIKNDLVIYQAASGAIELKGDIKKETIWATQAQIADVFGVERSVVTKHIKNLFNSSEVIEKSNVQKMHIASSDKPINFYSLDVILAVGYRTNSSRAIEFRKWATKILRQHISQGYTINPGRIKKNYEEFLSAVDKVRTLLPSNLKTDTDSILELVKIFADTWLSLSAYDQENFIKGKITKKKISLSASELLLAIEKFKIELLKKSEATEIFAKQRSLDAIEGIIGNVMQSFGGKEVYYSIEDKAAHLLYFMVKNHPFVDGNKRCGAFTVSFYAFKKIVFN